MEDKAMFLELDYVAKLSVVIFSALIFAFIFILLWKLVSFKYAAFFSVLFTLEPFLIGMRRLYHLDYLLTILLFLSFLLLVYFSYRTPKWFLLLFAGLFFALALLTKSSAVIFLPFVPVIVLLGNGVFYKKLIALLTFLLFSAVFIYVLFPAVWYKPLERAPKYIEKIAFGITGIGISGYKEMGTSGTRDNVVLNDFLQSEVPDFYFISLFMRSSVAGVVILIMGLGVFLYFCLKWPVIKLFTSIKNKSFPKMFIFKPETWVSFWSLCFSLVVLAAFSFATKKSDRYEIIVFPFLITLVAYFLNRAKLWLSLVLVLLYICFVIPEIINIRPYYLAYSNPYLGGIETRLNVLDGDPFGIGSYAALEVIKKDREKNGEQGFYTVSGSKSIKAISAGGKFSRAPSCVTDYVVTFALNYKPTYMCVQDYTLIGTVKVSGYDYWYVYRRSNQKHENNYE
jgi:4-amino-4-deoxy-L-arabinose transferase-like glycosyltransferase